jgi:hypothetical protein
MDKIMTVTLCSPKRKKELDNRRPHRRTKQSRPHKESLPGRISWMLCWDKSVGFDMQIISLKLEEY